MLKHIKYSIIILICSLLGCSHSMKQVLHDNFTDYTVSASVPPLRMPPGVVLPQKNNYFNIPNIIAAKSPEINLYPPGSFVYQAHTSRHDQGA